jgi:methyl-accepting chemotaxis protein
MDQVTQQNAAMVEQSTAASHALARETEELARLIGQFEIGERSSGATSNLAAVRTAKAASTSKPMAAMKTVGRSGAARKPAPEASDWQDF